jgi:hypothetical protein
MKREKQRNNAAIEYANAVTDGNQDAWFDVVLKTHQDATAWADKTIIEKACEFFAPYIPDNSGGYERMAVIENFKNYIKGE